MRADQNMLNTDHSKILPKLYQGAAPPEGHELYRWRFDVVVLCAEEYQPPNEAFPGVEVIRCPFDDRFDRRLTSDERRMIENTAARVARRVLAGKRTYVSCAQGINRSGLVTALAVRELTGCSGREATNWVRMRRPVALRNPMFRELLHALPVPRHRRAFGGV